MEKAFIEAQFPVSKVSKESYKERKAVQSQTLTGLGKWWGRKPLILVRAALLGCLLPATDNPQMDNEIFLKLMSMDEKGLLQRKERNFTVPELYDIVLSHKHLQKYVPYFDLSGTKPKLYKESPRDEMEKAAFLTLGYDAKIAMCNRPEHVQIEDEQTWREINHYLGTSASSLQELVRQLAERRFGRNVRVGDCFCGGGSIPFEAARIGCDTYASDLNPIAGLLSWADLHVCGGDEGVKKRIREFQQKAYNAIDEEICELGIEHNEKGDRALSYLYCAETTCPECGWKVPLLPSLIVGIRAGKVVAKLHENCGSFDISIHNDASASEMSEAQRRGTVRNNSLVCPHCGKTTSMSAIRHDKLDLQGEIIYGLRVWEKDEFVPRTEDVFQERLYAIRYEHIEVLPSGRTKSSRYYCAPSSRDFENEKKVQIIVDNNITEWQAKGYIPSGQIEYGAKTIEVIRNRGWGYWHQLFSPRQLLLLAKFAEQIHQARSKEEKVAGILGLNKCADFNSKLCRWNPNCDKTEQTYYNQALNALMNWGVRSLTMISTLWFRTSDSAPLDQASVIELADAHDVTFDADFWITDPPYADAVNYHELSEFFLAWDQKLLKEAFPEWYTDSKRVLAVRGDEHFSQTMIDIYSNLTQHMSDNGMQIVMFTHSDPAVWAQLALIMWKAGLTVTAAWNIATETDASGLKDGNYVKGTVLLVLRKQQGEEEAFLDELTADIKTEVKKQIESMQKLDDKEDPNFSDPDYVLAAYAASLKVLTSYKAIGEIDLDYELNLAINEPSRSEVVKLIERAKKIAYDFIIPTDFDNYLWRELSPSERFYIKGLESEKRGNYQVSTYQEYARGFGLQSYSQLMASERANTARLKTPSEFAMRAINDVPGFEDSVLRIVLAAIHVAVKEEENPQMGLWHLKTTVPNYWERRDMLKQLLSYLAECKDIDTMPHWKVCGEMASHMYTLVDNDRV